MKEQLAQLIEAYAAARASGNSVLQQLIAIQLQNFLNQIEITEASTPELSEAGGVAAGQALDEAPAASDD